MKYALVLIFTLNFHLLIFGVNGYNKVKLTDIPFLNFKKNEYTTNRRSSAVLQLQCIGGSYGCNIVPDSVQCLNKGQNGFDVQWECNGNLPSNAKFGTVSVSCEGYDSSSDPFVLEGSCGLKYTLESSIGILNVLNQNNKVKMSDVQSLTLNKGAKTTARRLTPILQLQCVGGSAGCSFEPNVVQCYNRGSDGVKIQWECNAQLSKGVKFGQLVVSCEGYDSSSDPYILAGSCGLKYQLERDGNNINTVGNNNVYSGGKSNPSGKSSSGLGKGAIIGIVIGGIVLLACCIIPICCCLKCFSCCKGGTKRENYPYQPTPTAPPGNTTIIHNPTPYYPPSNYRNNDYCNNNNNNNNNNSGGGGGGTQESVGFATTETR